MLPILGSYDAVCSNQNHFLRVYSMVSVLALDPFAILHSLFQISIARLSGIVRIVHHV